MADFNSKEYSLLRSIARKRIERAAAAGAAAPVHIPTVKEVKASADPGQYMAAVQRFLSSPGSKLSNIRKDDNITFTKFNPVPEPPATKRRSKYKSEEERRARRREQKRRSKAKRAVERAAETEAEARKKVGYLRALETVTAKWKEAGVDVANWLGVLSPQKAKAFTDYMEYRFSQGDYNNRYTIDTFIRDFGELVRGGYDFKDIQGDFSAFLERQKQMKKDAKNTNKYGISEEEVDTAWRKFVKKKSDEEKENDSPVEKVVKAAGKKILKKLIKGVLS